MLYTYARDNERKVKYNYPYSSMQNSLVASKLGHDENVFDASHSSFFSSSIPLSPVSSISPLPLSSRTIDTYSQTFDENIRRHRIQIVPSPPPVTQTSSRVSQNTDDCINSPVILHMDVDLHGNCKRNTSKSKAKISRSSEPSSTANTKAGPQQQILIVNSLQSLNSLTERSAITFINSKSILKLLSGSNFVGQSSVSKSSNSR